MVFTGQDFGTHMPCGAFPASFSHMYRDLSFFRMAPRSAGMSRGYIIPRLAAGCLGRSCAGNKTIAPKPSICLRLVAGRLRSSKKHGQQVGDRLATACLGLSV